MATQLIQFRASGEFLQWLESQQLDGESLNLTAQRLLKGQMEGESETSSASTAKLVSTPPSTPVYFEKPFQAPDEIEKIYAQMAEMEKRLEEKILGESKA